MAAGVNRPIFERFPELRERVPFEAIACLPTPVQHLRSLGLWVKRDDLTHPEIGGGKIRKLEFFLPRVRRPMLAVGTRGSNWLVALHHFASQVRIFTVPQHLNCHARKNAGILRGARNFADELLFALGVLAEVPRIASERLQMAPIGGTDPVTTLGYVNAALELGEQVRRGECPEPDAIFVAAGSCGSAAGLALGLPLAGLRSKLFAVRIAPLGRMRRIVGLAVQCAWLLDLKEVPIAPLEVLTDFNGGYARPIPAAVEAERKFRDAGLVVDTSYTAKSGAAALAYAKRFQAPLFWHTYGTVRG